MVILYAKFTGSRHPRQSFFNKAMPVGNKVSWMSTQK
jgi:hypothetical protein